MFIADSLLMTSESIARFVSFIDVQFGCRRSGCVYLVCGGCGVMYDCLLLKCGRSHTCQPLSVCQIWRTWPQPRRPSQQLVAVCLGQQACIIYVRAKLSSRRGPLTLAYSWATLCQARHEEYARTTLNTRGRCDVKNQTMTFIKISHNLC